VEAPLTVRREVIVVIHNIFGVIHAFKFLARQIQRLGALRADRDQNRVEAEGTQPIESQVSPGPERDVSVILKGSEF
jgi:hypothetical protein